VAIFVALAKLIPGEHNEVLEALWLFVDISLANKHNFLYKYIHVKAGNVRQTSLFNKNMVTANDEPM